MKEIRDISILMISMDTGLLKASGAGDVLDRHRRYAKNLKRLDIIVFGQADKRQNDLALNCRVYGVGKDIFSFIKAYILAKELHQKYSYDLVDTQDPHWTGFLGLLLKRKFKVKLEIHFHGDFWQNRLWLIESWKNRVYNFMQNIVVRQADAIRTVNPRIKDKLISSGVSTNKIRVINTPINEQEFIKEVGSQEIEKIKKQYNKKIIFFVGRLVASKNLIFLLEVIKLLGRKRNDFVLLIAGQGEEKENIVNFVNNNYLDDKVFLLGSKTHQELLSYFKASYLHILLSTNESFGKTIIESGLAGLATLASKTLGASFIIQDAKNGWLVEINDLKGTIEKLDHLLDQSEIVAQVSTQAKKDYIEHYSQDKTFAKVNNFWQEIVNEKL